jgi:hypothetical protein
MECAFYLTSTNRISESIVFWELFFQLFFEFEKVYSEGFSEILLTSRETISKLFETKIQCSLLSNIKNV